MWGAGHGYKDTADVSLPLISSDVSLLPDLAKRDDGKGAFSYFTNSETVTECAMC